MWRRESGRKPTSRESNEESFGIIPMEQSGGSGGGLTLVSDVGLENTRGVKNGSNAFGFSNCKDDGMAK